MKINLDNVNVRNIGGDVARVRNHPLDELNVKDFAAENIGGSILDIDGQRVRSIDALIEEITPHLNTLSDEQQCKLMSKLQTLRSGDKVNRTAAAEWLGKFANNVSAGMVATALMSFLKNVQF